MLYANTINGEKILATRKSRAICPFCKEVVIAKCGEINIWHWAHERNSDCDNWKEHETEWHLWWKRKFPKEWAERIIVKNGKRHIADILLPDGRVIEFQHSPISSYEIQGREMFYNQMVWVFDIRDAYDDILETSYYPTGDGGIDAYHTRRFHISKTDGKDLKFRWLHSKKSILMSKRPRWLHVGDLGLFYVKRVDDKYRNGLGYLKSVDEFVEYIIGRKYG